MFKKIGLAFIVSLLVSVLVYTPASALDNGTVSFGKGKRAITLVGDPLYGGVVTFDVYVHENEDGIWVDNACFQNGIKVYGETHGYWPGYRFGHLFSLGPTTMWQGGDADCIARVGIFNNTNFRSLASVEYIAYDPSLYTTEALAAKLSDKTSTMTISGPYGVTEFGQWVYFDAFWSDIPGYAWPMMTVGCFQDVNGDGLIVYSSGWTEDGVYLELVGPDSYYYADRAPRTGSDTFSFQLGGGSSYWHFSYGDAFCVAQGWRYSFKSGPEQVVSLGDPIYFWATDSRV